MAKQSEFNALLREEGEKQEWERPRTIIQIIPADKGMRIALYGDFKKAAMHEAWFKHKCVVFLALVEYSSGRREVLPMIVKKDKDIELVYRDETERLGVYL